MQLAMLCRDEESVSPDKLIYSCVMDNKPKYMHQALFLVWTLLDLASVPAKQIVVHAVEETDNAIVATLRRLGVCIRKVKPFADEFPQCNKLQQLATLELFQYDVAVLLDTDTTVLCDISKTASSRRIRARGVGGAHPPINVLREIFRRAGFASTPMLGETVFERDPTFRTNVNGGLYFLPRQILRLLSKDWPRWAEWLIKNKELINKRFHFCMDQIAFALACHNLGLDVDLLPLEMNYPIQKSGLRPSFTPVVLHYHAHMDASGFLKPSDDPRTNAAISQANGVLQRRRRRALDAKLFWNFHYVTTSESGSVVEIGKDSVDCKQNLLAKLVERMPDSSILDIGCGDLGVTQGLSASKYTGIDFSEEAIRIAKEKRQDWSFIVDDVQSISIHSHDLVLCLDVLPFQSTRKKYDDALAKITSLTSRTLIVSGYNQSPWYYSAAEFYYEPLSTSLKRIVPSAEISVVGGYRDKTILRVDMYQEKAKSFGGECDSKGTTRIKTPYGVFFCSKDDLITKQLRRFGGHTRNELAMLLSFVRRADLIIDVGAHIGTFAVPLAQAAGEEGKVYAIEPNADCLALLKDNVQANGLVDQIHIVEGLVGDKAKRFVQIIDPENSAASYFVEDRVGTDIPICSLDELWQREIFSKDIAIVKTDTEGMELSVLRSGQILLSQCRPVLYIEVVESHLGRYGHTVEELETLLLNLDYSFFCNAGPRNSGNDFFDIVSLANLRDGGTFFDCLAVPSEKVKALNLS